MSFYTAARDGQIELLKQHLQNGADVHQRFNNDRTALHFACDGGNVEVVKILLASQADVNQPDMFNKDTPLHLASEAGHTEVVRFLLENGGNVNAQDQMNGETPLHLACEAGFSDIVQLLLDYGADASIENVYKKRALHYADATTQEAIQRPPDAMGPAQNGNANNCLSHMDTISAMRKHILDSAVEGSLAGLPDAEEVEDDDFIRALDEAGPSRALQAQEGCSWYAAHSIAGRSSDGRDKQNQDAFLITHALGGDPDVSLFGVFDGHGRNGHLVSYFAKCVLPGILAREIDGIRKAAIDAQARSEHGAPSKAVISSGVVSTILSDACVTLQKMLVEQDKFDCQSSGSTAIFAVIAYGMIYMANVGDSRALLAHVTAEGNSNYNDREKLVVVPMSVDQVPNVREERERIEQSGGVVRRDEDSLTGEQGPFRVWRRDLAGPGLAMSRSIGDAAAHQIGVSTLPVVMEYKISEADRLLIIATDGVWDMLDNSEVVDISARASGDCKGDPTYASAQVCQTARRAWEFKETRVDDITCLLIFLPPQRAPAVAPGDSTSSSSLPAAALQHPYDRRTHIQADANYSASKGYTQPPHYTSIEPDPRPAAPSTSSYATDAYAASATQQSYAQEKDAIGSNTASSYIALSREQYGGQDRTIPYRPAEPMQHARQADHREEYGTLAYRPPQGDGAGFAPDFSGGYYRGEGVSRERSAPASLPPYPAAPTAPRYAPTRSNQQGAPRNVTPASRAQADGFFGMGNLVSDGAQGGPGQGGAKQGNEDCSIQ